MPNGEKTFEADYSHGGRQPFYLLGPTGSKPDAFRIDANVLRTRHEGTAAKWYFAAKDQPKEGLKANYLAGFEVTVDAEMDPCEIYLSDYKNTKDGKLFPHQFEVKYGDRRYGVFNIEKIEMNEGK
jgi:hypothetical protein